MSETKSIESETPAAVAGAAPCSESYPLFKHMSDTYQLTLLETELQEIRDAVNQCERLNVCEWKQDETHGYWAGGCGLAWEFTTGTPETNGFWCCPRCGRRIKTPNAPHKPSGEKPTT